MASQTLKKIRNKRTRDKQTVDQMVDELRGKYAWIPYSSEDFCRDKRMEIMLENRA